MGRMSELHINTAPERADEAEREADYLKYVMLAAVLLIHEGNPVAAKKLLEIHGCKPEA